MDYHVPVLAKEVLEYLKPQPGRRFIDATLGDGGHTIEFLREGAEVLGIDYHCESIDRAQNRIENLGLAKNFKAVRGNFKDIEKLATQEGFTQVNGILFDLGFSSTELEEDVGLSFNRDQPLDMRLDENLGVTAADLVNALPESQLARIFREYSDERYAKRFAKAIVEARQLKPLQTTRDLAVIIKSAAPSVYERGRIHPATRVFQALRIAVNDEIENLRSALPQAARLLLPGGRMAVISFHSLEDKTVKKFGRTVQPVFAQITEGPVTPTEPETGANPHSRSAKLRVFEKRCLD